MKYNDYNINDNNDDNNNDLVMMTKMIAMSF